MQGTPTPAENTAWQAVVFAVVAGAADTVGFLGFGAFAGLMSGNTVLLGIGFASGRWDDVLRSTAIIISFLTGLAAAMLLRRLHIAWGMLVAAEAMLLVLAALLPATPAAPVLALAMGMQNAMATRFVGLPLNTVFITGDLQKMVRALLSRLSGAPEAAEAPRGEWVILVLWAGYLGGAALGTVAHAQLARPLLVAPLLLLLVLLHASRRR